MKLFEKRLGLIIGHVLKNLLQNSTAVRVSSKSKGLTSKGLADKKVHIAVNALQGSLKDVISVLIFGALNNFAFQLFNE